MGLVCKVYKKWVEEKIEKFIEEWVEKRELKCKQRKWYDPRRWFCWIEITFVKVIKRVVVTVGKWVTYIICEVINSIIDFLISSRLWGEGDSFDLWSVVHFLAGLVLGSLFCLLAVSFWLSLLIVLILLILWEIFELIKGWEETHKNRVVDVLIGILGFFIAFFLFPQLWVVFLLLLLLWIILSILGWIAFKRRPRKG